MRGSVRAAIAVASLALTAQSAAAADRPAKDDRPIHHGDDYVFVVDPKFGMEAGVRTTDSLYRLVSRYEDALPTVVRLDEMKPLEKGVGIFGRTLKLLFIDEPLAEFSTVAIHEVFGHGARGQEFGAPPSPSFYLPGIYCKLLTPGERSDCTAYSGVSEGSGLVDRDLGITAGGIESNMAQAWWLNARTMQRDGWIRHGELLAYMIAKGSYFGTFTGSELASGQGLRASNDVGHYVGLLQDRFNAWRPEDRHRVATRLQAGYLWNLADPMLLYAAYGTIVESLYRGKREMRVPLPKMGDVAFLPSPRFNLSPFGGEHYLDAFFSRRGVLADVYARTVSSGLASATGFGVRTLGFKATDRVELGGELDVWSQPEILPGVREIYDRDQRAGINMGGLATVRVIDRLGITAKLAYKTPGYVMAQPLEGGLYGYAGISIAQ